MVMTLTVARQRALDLPSLVIHLEPCEMIVEIFIDRELQFQISLNES